MSKDIIEEFKSENTVDEHHINNHLQDILDNHDLDATTKEVIVDQIKKLNKIKTKDFSEIEQKFIDEEFKGKVDLKFLVKESEESDDEYGQEVFETLKN